MCAALILSLSIGTLAAPDAPAEAPQGESVEAPAQGDSSEDPAQGESAETPAEGESAEGESEGEPMIIEK